MEPSKELFEARENKKRGRGGDPGMLRLLSSFPSPAEKEEGGAPPSSSVRLRGENATAKGNGLYKRGYRA